MWFPKKYHYNPKTFTTMKVNLNVTATSDIRKMGRCPNNSQSICGIAYRAL